MAVTDHIAAQHSIVSARCREYVSPQTPSITRWTFIRTAKHVVTPTMLHGILGILHIHDIPMVLPPTWGHQIHMHRKNLQLLTKKCATVYIENGTK